MLREAKLLALVVALLLVPLLVGCPPSQNVQLQTYRNGLHALDEPIYQDYLAYVSEAEAKGTRSPAVISVNRSAVQKAEEYYNSAAPVPTPAPTATTQP